jgi:hypothetical protein
MSNGYNNRRVPLAIKFSFCILKMMLEFFLIVFLSFFSLIIASHFLGGSFTYRHIQQSIDYKKYSSVLVELRFHISNHYFICTPEQVNEHLIVYLIGETVPYDETNKKYLWYDTEAIRKKSDFYQIQCVSERNNQACTNFQEETWAYCESANQNSGYSILRRQFLLIIERFKPIQLLYVCKFIIEKSYYLFYSHHAVGLIHRINISILIYLLKHIQSELIRHRMHIYQLRIMLILKNQQKYSM